MKYARPFLLSFVECFDDIVTMSKDSKKKREIEVDFNEVNPDFTSINGIKLKPGDLDQAQDEEQSEARNDDKTVVSLSISRTGLYIYNIDSKEINPLADNISLGSFEDQQDFFKIKMDDDQPYLFSEDENIDIRLNGLLFYNGKDLNPGDLIEVYYTRKGSGLEEKYRYIITDKSKLSTQDINRTIAKSYLANKTEDQQKVLDELEEHIHSLDEKIDL